MSKPTKFMGEILLVIPVPVHGAEAWTVTINGVFERKISRNIYGPLRFGGGECRRQWNDELCEPCNGIDIIYSELKFSCSAGLFMWCEWTQTLQPRMYLTPNPLVEAE